MDSAKYALAALFCAACSGGVEEETGESDPVVAGHGEDPSVAGDESPDELGNLEGETEKALCTPRSDWVATVTVGNGFWGSWASCSKMCSIGSYAYRANVKSLAPQGVGIDDSAANALSLWCYNRFTGAFTGYLVSQEGPNGGWQAFGGCGEPNVPGSAPIKRGMLRLEGPLGSGNDDTAMNTLMVGCQDDHPDIAWEIPTNTPWGVYQLPPLKTCPAGTAVCGVRTRLEAPQGSGDDTALNGVQFECCSY